MSAGALRVALVVVAAGCGGPRAPATPPADLAYADMSHEQRVAFMERTVMPEMRRAFAEFDPAFADMDCATCHGAGVDDGTYQLPNPELWTLPTQAGWAALAPDDDQTRWLEFMGGVVKPRMAALLGMSDYDWQTGVGDFNCGHCHPQATD
ncbi:MAG: hypothetical protein R2939_14935 [Kofleriaceae bacterium]